MYYSNPPETPEWAMLYSAADMAKRHNLSYGYILLLLRQWRFSPEPGRYGETGSLKLYSRAIYCAIGAILALSHAERRECLKKGLVPYASDSH